jgi:molybdopterin converting factor small subunit
MGSVEVRGFGDLRQIFEERDWPFPLLVSLEDTTTTRELAKKLDIPVDNIEVTFVNGLAQGLDYPVKPGDRIAFVPPGTPGPYRVFLGFMQKKP